ncbi:2Fe-2S iron-sulfur cluster-binding protein [Prochlorococcus sp. MIT 1307]|uniref:2Fe-2S iron-sulfur cluster-binding protein n=1 Tax=Prochlorococcus sp. MIT 1307 TaxID=3096219 RepID=UPI002A76018F|nr:2Fe-2S iron-sulfur cluster-binding protein [Prochlorococcus sp. MIT 1307]
MKDITTSNANFTINIEINSLRRSFICKADQTVLEAAEEASISLPSSCLVGMCCSCAALLKEGSIAMEEAMGLKTDLREKGFVLLCQSYPKSDLYLIANQEEAVSS